MKSVYKILLTLALVFSFILTIQDLSFALSPGTTAANFLKIPVGARAAAMGGAFTATADDATALYWNPAGLSQIEKTEILAMYNMHFQGIKQGYLSLAFPSLKGVVGLAASYVDMGGIEGRDKYGNPTGEFNASDIKLSFGYSRRLSSRLMFGLTFGSIQETIANDKKVSYSANIGFMLKPVKLISVGFTCQNIGSKLGKDSLPLTYRGGIALKLRSFSIETDVVKEIDNDVYYCAGLEWDIANISLRCGYRMGQDVGSGISYGIGLKVSKVNLDYAFIPYGDLGDTQRISLGIKF